MPPRRRPWGRGREAPGPARPSPSAPPCGGAPAAAAAALLPGCMPACGFAEGWNPVAMSVIATSPSASWIEGFTTAPKMISALGSTSS